MDEAVCACTCGGRGCASRAGRPGARAGLTIHGTKAGYGTGCRCVECGAAHITETSRKRSRANDATLDGATRYGYGWTSADLEVALNPAYTAREAAGLIGRTLHSVRNMRSKAARNDLRIIP